MLSPYEIAIVEAGSDSTIVQVTGDVGLSDLDAIALAKQRLQDLQDLIDLMDENPGLLVVRRGIIAPPALNIRLAKRQDELAQ